MFRINRKLTKNGVIRQYEKNKNHIPSYIFGENPTPDSTEELFGQFFEKIKEDPKCYVILNSTVLIDNGMSKIEAKLFFNPLTERIYAFDVQNDENVYVRTLK